RMQRIPKIETHRLIAREPVREQWMAWRQFVLRVMRERAADVRGGRGEDARIGFRTWRHVEDREEVAVCAIEVADPRGEIAAARELLRIRRHCPQPDDHGSDETRDPFHDACIFWRHPILWRLSEWLAQKCDDVAHVGRGVADAASSRTFYGNCLRRVITLGTI